MSGRRLRRAAGTATAAAAALAASLVVAGSGAGAAAGPPGGGVAREAHLAFDLEPRPRPTDGATGFVPVAARWMDAGGRVAWRAALPERMTRAFPLGEPEASIYREDERRYDLLRSFVTPGVIAAGDALLVADLSGLLVLARKDGAIQLDWEAARSPHGHALFFDSARVEVKGAGKKACRGSGTGGRFLLVCGTTAVYCNRSRFAVFEAKPWRLVAEAAYDPKAHDVPAGKAGTYRVKARVGGVVVEIDGIVYLY